jgi:6-phosphogluconolactonase
MIPDVHTFTDQRMWVDSAADLICRSVSERISQSGVCTLALAGGKTPQSLYKRLSQPPYLQAFCWPAIHIFLGDERCVPFEHEESNFGMANRHLISRVPIPPGNCHPIPIYAGPSSQIALQYEEELKQHFQHLPAQSGSLAADEKGRVFPVFDLIILGMGKDGHTASLFPGDPALKEKIRWAAFVQKSPRPPRLPRATLTLPVLRRARLVLFFVSEAEKKEILPKVLDETERLTSAYPAALIRPEGKLVWMILKE